MVLPQRIPPVQEPAIASYNFIDIISGTGIVELYAGRLVDTDLLSNVTYYSDTVFTNSGNIGISADAQRLDIDFDVLVNKPMTVKGKIVVNVPIAARRSGSTTTAHVVITVRKFDGSTETDLVTNDSTILGNSSAVVKYLMTGTDLDIPQTHFKKGDILRLTIELWGSGGASPASVEFAHDPKDRDTGWDSTVSSILTFQMPVRNDL